MVTDESSEVASSESEYNDIEVSFKRWVREDGKIQNVQFRWMLKMSLKIGTKQLPPSRSISTLNDTNIHRISHNGRYQSGEVLIHCDYSENYKNTQQNEIQSAYFGQSSFSLLTACIYYVVEEGKK